MYRIKVSLTIFSAVLLFVGCTEQNENKKEKISSAIKVEQKDDNISSKLLEDIVYSINNKTYGMESLPHVYANSLPKEREKFLNIFINNKIMLDKLSEKQKLYKNEIDIKLGELKSEWKRRGFMLDTLSNIITIQKATLDIIAFAEVAKDDDNITDKVQAFYEDKKSEYYYPNGVEISLIVLDNRTKAEGILKDFNSTDKNNLDIFVSMVNKYSIDKAKKIQGGYGGFITEKSSKIFFDELWDNKEIGIYSKIIEYKKHYFIVYIHKRKEKGLMLFSDVKEDIKKYLLNDAKEFYLGATQRELLKSTNVTIYDKFKEKL